ncbi:MAG: hypothetical protein R2838_01200 [Caldilineaceae bacterium]
MTMGQSDAPAGPGAEATAPAAEEAAAPEGTGAMATVATRSLRVRSAPNPDAEVVAGVREGETYPVVDLSSDGEWVLLAVLAARRPRLGGRKPGQHQRHAERQRRCDPGADARRGR